jgi:hypothetical protein
MNRVRIVEEQASILLLARGDRFAVVDRRNQQLYNLHGGRREPDPLTDKGAEHAVGADWCSEIDAADEGDHFRRVYHAHARAEPAIRDSCAAGSASAARRS